MMVSVETYLRRGERQLRLWSAIPGVMATAKLFAYGGGGFLLSAIRLFQGPQPFAMGLCCAVGGWRALIAGIGSGLGYRLFWQEQGVQGILWATAGALLGLLSKQKDARQSPYLIPALASFLVCLLGFLFQVFQLEQIPFGSYLSRVLLAGLSALLLQRRLCLGDDLSCWFCSGIAILALGSIAPGFWLNPGFFALGLLTASGRSSAAICGGLALDLAAAAPVPMTVVACLSCYLQPAFAHTRRFPLLAPCGICLLLMILGGNWWFFPLPSLLLGSAVGLLLPRYRQKAPQSRTGFAQVQLELAAGVFADTQQMLLETPSTAIDEAALLDKIRLRTCSLCPIRKDCQEQSQLTTHYLQHPLDFACRRPGQILTELRLGREQLLSLRREKTRLLEYRRALIQQYQFLSLHLRDLSDQLQNRDSPIQPRYHIRVSARSRSKAVASGDQCLAFPGTRCRCYVVLFDGMGSGLGAAQEGQTTALLVKKMLCAGFSAQHAFRSINSILTLQGRAGAVTLDLAEIDLNSGRATLYKWGAAPSWLLSCRGLELMGTVTMPPGLSMDAGNPDVITLSLSMGQTLILLSDGAFLPEAALRGKLTEDMPPGDIAATILGLRSSKNEDDATIAAIRLERLPLQKQNREG